MSEALQIALMGPQAADYTRRAAAKQFRDATSTQPLQHWTQAAAQVVGGLGSSMRETQAAENDQQAAQIQKDALMQALNGGSISDASAMLMGNPATADMGAQLAQSVLSDRMQKQNAAAGPPKTINVGGNLVAVKPDGSTEVLFSAPNQSSPINVDGNLVTQNPDGSLKFLYKKPPSIAERLLQGAPTQQPGAAPAPAPAQPQGGFIQQSNPVEQQTDPNLQLTAGGAVPEAAPAPSQDMVTLPSGQQLPRAQAEQLRFGLALEGNKAAVDALDAVLNPESNQIGEAASNEIDKSILNSGNLIERLEGIKRTFKEKFMGWGHRLNMLGLSTWSKIAPGSLKPEQQAALREYAAFRRQAADNTNRYIKEITGAQMSEAEAERLMLGVPSAGQGIFDGDDPDSFVAKMEDAMTQAKISTARMYYLKKNGFKPQYGKDGRYITNLPMGLDDTADMIQQRTRQLQQRARAEGVPPQQAAPWVQKNLKQEFGI